MAATVRTSEPSHPSVRYVGQSKLARRGTTSLNTTVRTSLLSPGVRALVIELDDRDPYPVDSPTTEQIASHLADLRRVMGVDIPTLAARAQLEPRVVAEIEAGTRAWTLDELLAIAFGLGVTITSVFRRFDPPTS